MPTLNINRTGILKKGKSVPTLCRPQIACYKEHPIINGGSGCYIPLVKHLIFFSALGLVVTLSFLRRERSLFEFQLKVSKHNIIIKMHHSFVMGLNNYSWGLLAFSRRCLPRTVWLVSRLIFWLYDEESEGKGKERMAGDTHGRVFCLREFVMSGTFLNVKPRIPSPGPRGTVLCVVGLMNNF